MKLFRVMIIVIIFILIAFRLVFIPNMHARHLDETLYEFVVVTDLYLIDFEDKIVDEQLSEIIENISFSEMGYAYVLDENGIILLHPNKEIIGSNIGKFNLPEITEAIESLKYAREERIIEYEYEGVTKFARFYRDENSRIIAFTDTYERPSVFQMIVN